MSVRTKQTERLEQFVRELNVAGKGALSVALTLTASFKTSVFPLKQENFLSPKEGQVAGLGGDAVKRILAAHGISQTLAKEGGRTSRGSIDLMRAYVVLVNELWHSGSLDLEAVELFWIARVQEHFSAKPFRLRIDRSSSVRSLVRDLLMQAQKRQRQNPGSTFAGTVAQHLVSAKLRCLMGGNAPKPHNASAADESGSRAGDFEVGECIIHVTLSPSDALLEKCATNISADTLPIIVTTAESVPHTVAVAERLNIQDRVEIWSLEQFVSSNVREWGGFTIAGSASQVRRLIEAYNSIIDEVEEQPSLKIET